MIKVLYFSNPNLEYTIEHINIDIIDNTTIKYTQNNYSITIENIKPYSTYYIIYPRQTDNLNELNVSSEFIDPSEKFKVLTRENLKTFFKLRSITTFNKLFNCYCLIQIDVGNTSKEHNIFDAVISLSNILNTKYVTINTTHEVLYEEDPSIHEEMIFTDSPRMRVWDSYSLTVNNIEYKRSIKEMDEIYIPLKYTDFIEFNIQKYKGLTNFKEKLSNEYDSEELSLYTSAGILNANKLELINGQGTFRLYPSGYTGKITILMCHGEVDVAAKYNFILE
jgi:hypothetical protein